MRKIGKKKIIVGVVATAVIAAGAGTALAYWTTSGSGTGSATAATANGTLALHASFAGGITPGGSKTVSFSADNAGSSNLQVGTVHSVVSTSDPANCLASWFSISDVLENQTIAASTSGVALTNTGTLTFNDSTTDNQDACKGATITLTLSS